MTMNISNEFKTLTANPDDYIRSLPANVESVMLVIKLMEFSNKSSILIDAIKSNFIIEPEYITMAPTPQAARLELLYLAYLTGPTGVTDITEYYSENYAGPTSTFDLHAHLELLSMLYTRLMSNGNNKSLYEDWLISGILHTTFVVDTIYEQKEQVEKSKLAGLMPLYSMFDLPGVDLSKSLLGPTSKSLKDVKQQLESLATYIYGNKFNHILDIARILNVSGDRHFWMNATIGTSTDTYPLPTLS